MRFIDGNRNFHTELDFFLEKVKTKNHFGMARFGDGEQMIIEGEFIDLRNKNNGEFKYDPNDKAYEVSRRKLAASLTYQDPDYFVGLGCRCCVGDEKHEYLKKYSQQKEEQITWANLIVNSNYTRFLFGITDILKRDRPVVLVANEKVDLSEFPFQVRQFYPVGVDSWINQLELIDQIKNDIDQNQIEDQLFFICAGPFANILVYELFKFNRKNTYLDTGSALDVLLGLPPTRDYLIGKSHLDQTCIW